MDHKPVHSQLDRHQVLMDLAKAVTQHVADNPHQPDYYEHEETQGQSVPSALPSK